MKSSTKAVLLSCFVLPGAGHLYLKRYRFGFLLLACAVAVVYFIASSAVQTALEVAEEIQASGFALDANAIAELVAQQSRAGEESAYSAMTALGIVWLIGIFDSYRVGRVLDNAQGVADGKEA
ncbi:MAG: hypothetical protein P8J17_06920 [Halioglobus sp.]|nr:hypothetical protein [Halioglobus sp.]